MTDTVDPPYRLSPFENIVNVSLGGAYALVWVFGFANYGYYPDGPRLGDQNGFVNFEPTITDLIKGAKIVYQRVEGPISDPSKPPKTFWGVYAPPQTTVPQTGASPVVLTSQPDDATFKNRPIDAAYDASGFWGFFGGFTQSGGFGSIKIAPTFGDLQVDLSGLKNGDGTVNWPMAEGPVPGLGPTLCGSGNPIALYDTNPPEQWTEAAAQNLQNFLTTYPPCLIGNGSLPGDPTFQYVTEWTVTSTTWTYGTFEAVFLIKLPGKGQVPTEQPATTTFTVNLGAGYACDLWVQLFPTSGISVDPTNTSDGPEGGSPTGRVYVPLKWTSGKPPKDWDGFSINNFDDLTDVGNATTWQMLFSTVVDSGNQAFRFVFAYASHLTDPTTGTATQPDKISEIYLQSPPPNGLFNVPKPSPPPETIYPGSGLIFYCDVPYGTVFDARPFGDFQPGPFPLIDSDEPA
jgi:hypothetical protein